MYYTNIYLGFLQPALLKGCLRHTQYVLKHTFSIFYYLLFTYQNIFIVSIYMLETIIS